jgi:hypothetical protein
MVNALSLKFIHKNQKCHIKFSYNNYRKEVELVKKRNYESWGIHYVKDLMKMDKALVKVLIFSMIE